MYYTRDLSYGKYQAKWMTCSPQHSMLCIWGSYSVFWIDSSMCDRILSLDMQLGGIKMCGWAALFITDLTTSRKFAVPVRRYFEAKHRGYGS